jgi:hypothetical protein
MTWSSGSSGLGNEFVVLVPPGESVVQCRDYENLPNPPQSDKWMETAPAFDLVDPNGYWVTTDVECPNPRYFSESFPPEADIAPEMSAADAARAVVPGIQEGDDVEAAGYVASSYEDRTIAVVRSGHVVAAMTQSTGDPSSFTGFACPESGVADR